MSNKSIRPRHLARIRLRILQSGLLGAFIVGSLSVAVGSPIVVSAASATVGTSTSALGFQHSAADKVAYLHDGSLLIGYFDGSQVVIKHVTNPSTAPASTQVDVITQGSEVTLYTLPGVSSTEIWIAVGNELFGGTKREQIQYGTYNGSAFSFGAVSPIPGALTNGRQDPTVTWTGKWLIASWWDDTLGGNSDSVFVNWTTDKTGQTGWLSKYGTTAAATVATATTITYTAVTGGAPIVGDWYQFGDGANAEYRQVTAVSGSAPYTLTVAALANAHAAGEIDTEEAAIQLTAMGGTIVQVSIRHSAKLGATIAVYGARSHLYTRTLLDSKANPSLANWTAESTIDGLDDSEFGFGGPQVAIDEATGKIHVFRAVTNHGGPSWTGVTYWLGTPDAVPMATGTVSWNSRLVIDRTAGATDPPDIAGAVDSHGKVYVFWATSVTGGAIKSATLSSPYTSASTPYTVATTGANPRFPHVPAQAPLTGTYVPLVYQSGAANPFSIILDTSVSTVGVGSPCQTANLTTSPVSPGPTGGAVIMTASSTGCPNPVYRFWIKDPGRRWSIVQDYSPSNTHTWTQTYYLGVTNMEVDVRDASESTVYDVVHNITFTTIGCTAANISFNPTSPQTHGTAVVFTGSSTCPGTGAQYRFWIFDPGRRWSMVKDYSASNTYNWAATSTLATGVYRIEVDVRDAGSGEVYEVVFNTTYTMT